MDTIRSTRTAALVCVVGTAYGAVYAAAAAITAWEPSLSYAFRVPMHLAALAGVIGLVLSGAAGTGWLGRVGLGAATLGQVLLSAAELTYPGRPEVGEQLFMIAPPLSAIGMVLAGVAVLRTGRWTGWLRFTPLIVGLYVFVIQTPVFVIAGPPPAAAAVWTIAGWELCWVLLGVALWTDAAVVIRSRRSPVTG